MILLPPAPKRTYTPFPDTTLCRSCPFGTLGWPDETQTLKRHYPNDLLISGFDILFFWNARMVMQGLEFMKEVPWQRLYLHGLVRAADGSKMSKRSEEHTSELQSLMRISYAVFCLKKKIHIKPQNQTYVHT